MSISDRAGRPGAKKLTALEALALAVEREEAELAAAAAPESIDLDMDLEMVRAPTPPPTRRKRSRKELVALVSDAVRRVLAAVCVLGTPAPVTNVQVFTALWRAHAARARKAGDVQLAVTASALLDAIERSDLTVARVEAAGEIWAVWVNDRGRLVGAAQPADTYLAGSGISS